MGAGDPALNATNSSSATPSMPDWLRNLSEFTKFRGDECFRARFGDHVSLLESDGNLATGFSTDPNQCDPRLRLSAESIGAFMKIRNGVVAELLVARAELQADKVHLAAEENLLEEGQKAALQEPGPPDGVDFNALQQNVDTARAACKAAQDKFDILIGALDDAQSALRMVHDQAEKQIAQSAPDLAILQEQATGDSLWEYLKSVASEGVLLRLERYVKLAGASSLGAALVLSQDLHVGDLFAPFLPPLDGVEDLSVAAFQRDVMCSFVIGLIILHVLIATGVIDL